MPFATTRRVQSPEHLEAMGLSMLDVRSQAVLLPRRQENMANRPTNINTSRRTWLRDNLFTSVILYQQRACV